MFRNLQIRSKLGAILVLPLVALIVFASLQVGSSISRRAEANRTNLLTGLANRLTALTDSLQQERATSTGYVASGKGRFRPEMMQSRAKADRNAASLRDGLVDLDVSDYSARLRDDIADSSRRLDGLANWRTQLDGADLPTVTRVESFYGELLTSLLAVIADIGNEPGSRSVKADIAALVEISRAKEAASQSTSLLFAALIKGEFGPGDYPRFATLSSKVGEYLKVEQRVASDVAAAATSDRDAAVRQTVLTTVIMILVLALAIGLSLLLSNSMARPLYALEKSARDVAEQHLPGVVERLERPDAQVDEAGIEAMAASGGVPVRSRDEIGRVAGAFNSVHEVAIRIAAEQAALRNSIGAMFLNLARRSQRLVDRQLELIDELERDEADPDALENLFKLDHLATRMRRNAEDLIVLSGAEPPRRWSEPVPLPQVVRGAVAEVEDYQRIELLPIDDVGAVGHAVADIIHLLAELLENATSFSPPGTSVRVAGQPAATGYVVEIEDRGLGMSDEELLDANQRLANPPVVDFAVSRMLGLFVVGRLAQRYGIRVQLRHSWYGGVTALVLLPSALLTWSGMEGHEGELPGPRPELVPPAPEGRPSTHPATPTTSPPPPVAQPARASTPSELPIEQPVPPVTRAAATPPPPVSEPVASNGEGIQEGAEAGGRMGDRLPIFEQARSDWFDSASGASYLPMRRHAPQPSSGEQAPPVDHGLGRRQPQPPAPPTPPPAPPQPAPTRQAAQAPRPRARTEDPSAVPLPPVSPGSPAQGRTGRLSPGAGAGGPPSFGPGPGGPGPGGRGADAPGPGMGPVPGAGPGPGMGPGQPDPGQRLTRTGLPRRVPRANLAPGIATTPSPQPQQQQQPVPAPGQARPAPRQVSRTARSPEDVRAMLSSYRSGLERGRRMAAGPDTLRYEPGGDDDVDRPDGAEEQR